MDAQIEEALITSYIERGYWQDRTIGDFVHQRAHEEGGRIALVDQSCSLTYRELDEAADRVAGLLAHNGVNKGDRVILQLKNSVWHVVAMFGIAKAGAIPIMALCAHRLRELESFARRAEPVAMIVNEVHQGFDYRALAHDVQARVPSVKAVLTQDDIVRAARSGAPCDTAMIEKRRPAFTDIGPMSLT